MALKPYPILRLTIPLATGIFLSDTWLRSFDLVWVHQLLLLLLLVPIVWLVQQPKYAHRLRFGILLSLFLLLLGSLVTQLQWRSVSPRWKSEKAVYKGVIQELPVTKEKSIACRVRTDDKDVLLYIAKDSLAQTLTCGDELLFYTQINAPRNAGNPHEFDYASYLLRQQISGTAFVYSRYWQKTFHSHPLTLKQQALVCRSRVLDYFRQWGFEAHELAVLSALTIGYKEDLSDELRDAYAVAGISHVLALSGLHVGVFWFLLSFLLSPLNRKMKLRILKWFLITLILWAFAFMVGLTPSVVRAVIMCMLVGLSQIKRHCGTSLNTLAIAAFFMLLYAPFYLFDVSFQLSFIAVLSILLFYPRIFSVWQVHNRVLRYMWGVAAVSLAAQLGTAPFIVYYFSNFSIYFLLANLMAAPLIPFIIYLTLFSLLIAPVPFLHTYAVLILEKSILFLNEMAVWIAHLPFASLTSLSLSAVEVGLLYVILFTAFNYQLMKRRKGRIVLLGQVACFSILFSLNHAAKRPCSSLIFYAMQQSPAVHFIESDRSSYLYAVKGDSALADFNYIRGTFWKKEGLRTPYILPASYQDAKVCSSHGIVHWKGKHIAIVAGDEWRNKRATHLLPIDYLYVCKGYKGKLVSLQKLFRMKKIVLDAGLNAYRAASLKEECNALGIDYIDLSAKGSFRILL